MRCTDEKAHECEVLTNNLINNDTFPAQCNIALRTRLFTDATKKKTFFMHFYDKFE